eukprot:scaffold1929_cov376-Prasinococcus_capsulatus_cf.AAC.24
MSKQFYPASAVFSPLLFGTLGGCGGKLLSDMVLAATLDPMHYKSEFQAPCKPSQRHRDSTGMCLWHRPPRAPCPLHIHLHLLVVLADAFACRLRSLCQQILIPGGIPLSCAGRCVARRPRTCRRAHRHHVVGWAWHSQRRVRLATLCSISVLLGVLWHPNTVSDAGIGLPLDWTQPVSDFLHAVTMVPKPHASKAKAKKPASTSAKAAKVSNCRLWLSICAPVLACRCPCPRLTYGYNLSSQPPTPEVLPPRTTRRRSKAD